MDILISAILGDLVSRSASFVISKYFQQQPDIDKIVQRVQSVLLRINIVVEEAEERHITNQGMLHQLKMLRQGMYRGHYVLDALRFQAALDEEVSHSSSALSKSSPAKRLRFSRTGSGSSNREALLFGTNSNMREELQQMVDTLEDTMAGMKEFIFFLESYPRILRQPYGTYLLLDNCMFGRQTERERVLNFLLCPSATSDLAVLPIVGPIRVGKSTLVEYVCRDESVRDHFSMILFFTEGSLRDEGVVDLLRIKHVVIQTALLPGHSPDLVCCGVGVTSYSTPLLPNRAFKYGPRSDLNRIISFRHHQSVLTRHMEKQQLCREQGKHILQQDREGIDHSESHSCMYLNLDTNGTDSEGTNRETEN